MFFQSNTCGPSQEYERVHLLIAFLIQSPRFSAVYAGATLKIQIETKRCGNRLGGPWVGGVGLWVFHNLSLCLLVHSIISLRKVVGTDCFSTTTFGHITCC